MARSRYTATRTVNLDVTSYTMTNGVTDGITENHPTTNPTVGWEIDMKLSKPVITETITTDSWH